MENPKKKIKKAEVLVLIIAIWPFFVMFLKDFTPLGTSLESLSFTFQVALFCTPILFVPFLMSRHLDLRLRKRELNLEEGEKPQKNPYLNNPFQPMHFSTASFVRKKYGKTGALKIFTNALFVAIYFFIAFENLSDLPMRTHVLILSGVLVFVNFLIFLITLHESRLVKFVGSDPQILKIDSQFLEIPIVAINGAIQDRLIKANLKYLKLPCKDIFRIQVLPSNNRRFNGQYIVELQNESVNIVHRHQIHRLYNTTKPYFWLARDPIEGQESQFLTALSKVIGKDKIVIRDELN